ncbi:hypothetical protein DNTS_016206 [Danionella cerebrum]|uniref:Cation/H+ exchanger protein 2 n=1 Tax=Danionella cerebrum TaxID=2873325 RepID=A0A553Q0I7_9TELE|nr:hypothetical protein DNTS_016206 [Danionella translucida]
MTSTETRRTKAEDIKQDVLDEVDGALPGSCFERVCVAHVHSEDSDGPPNSGLLQTSCSFTPKNPQRMDDNLENLCKTSITAENPVEAQKLANNYKFGFRKWKSHVTERPFEDRSDVVKELYSSLTSLNHRQASDGQSSCSLFTCGNVFYVLLFGWWVSLLYVFVGVLMTLTVFGIPYGRLCWSMSCYFLWPFGKSIKKVSVSKPVTRLNVPQENLSIGVDDHGKVSTPLLLPVLEEPTEEPIAAPDDERYWRRLRTYVWLLLGLPLLVVAHSLLCLISWLLVFTIPVAKMSTKTLHTILLMPPDCVYISQSTEAQEHEDQVILCCYHAVNIYYYKYSVDGINVFAVNLLPLVIVSLVIGYVDQGNQFASSELKFAFAVASIVPLSYYIGMGIASISAQSNFAVGAVVNATFGSIAELTFYITALLKGHQQGKKCLEEIVKAALTGTLLGCILFIPGLCMIIGGLKHQEQRFNSRSAGVSSSLLFISIGGVFAPTLFSKAYGNLVCEDCSNSTGSNTSGSFMCRNCHYDLSENNSSLFHSHIEPLVYTVSFLLPMAYLIGLIFTLKTHSHIYDVHIGEGTGGHLGASVHWSRWRALLMLIVATVLMSTCADLTTEHIQPILNHSPVSQYFIGVTVLAMVPEIPEIVNGVQFALQNKISLSLEVGSCIAVQVCMIQIPVLVAFDVFYDVGFVLIFSDLHLWTSIFSVILVNYIFMDGKCDYFQGTALVVVYLILLALYFFAPSPAGC